jgi:hypothetical protein
MASAPKLVGVDRRLQSPLTPELKEFIDRAIVPALVQQYVAVLQVENELAAKPPSATHSQRNAIATLGRPRP